MKPMIVGFMGLAGVGKTTAARAIFNLFPGRASILSFATPLKTAAADLFLFTPEQLYGNKKEEVDPRWGFSPRTALQQLGTECVRKSLLENFWVLRMEEVIRTSPYQVILIDDLRFEDEALMVYGAGNYLSKTVLIDRPGVVGSGHSSENPPRDVADDVWANEGTLSDFVYAVQHSDTVDMIGRYLTCG